MERAMFKLSQATIAIVTVGLALAGLDVHGRIEARADREAIRAEARAEREAIRARAGPTAPKPKPPAMPSAPKPAPTAKPSSGTSPG